MTPRVESLPPRRPHQHGPGHVVVGLPLARWRATPHGCPPSASRPSPLPNVGAISLPQPRRLNQPSRGSSGRQGAHAGGGCSAGYGARTVRPPWVATAGVTIAGTVCMLAAGSREAWQLTPQR